MDTSHRVGMTNGGDDDDWRQHIGEDIAQDNARVARPYRAPLQAEYPQNSH